MFESVVDQVYQRLLDGARVEHRVKSTVGHVALQPNSALVRHRLHRTHSFLDELGNAREFEVVLLATEIDPRNIEHVLNEGRETLAFLDNEAEIFALLFGLGHASALEAFG